MQATGEDTDAVHRRFMKEPSANIKDGVTEPSKVGICQDVNILNQKPKVTLFLLSEIPPRAASPKRFLSLNILSK